MKSGAGDDPFADPATESGDGDAADEEVAPDAEGDVDADVDVDVDAESETDTAVDVDVDADVDADSNSNSDSDSDSNSSSTPTSTADSTSDSDGDATADEPDIPWVLRRRSVKDDRPNVTQFFLRDATDRAERRFRSEVEERLDTDVYMLDLREAAYLVAMEHPDEVADRLEEWGYEYLD